MTRARRRAGEGGPGGSDPMTARPGLGARDRAWLARAARLAAGGWGRVRPNPMVGCVLVKDGVVVGEGWHEEFGAPHAEANALEAAGAEARGATAYVTLEPCDHHGKTPPCSDALVEAGVRRVVYGARDPGPDASGGRHRLRDAGVDVTRASCDPELGPGVDPAFFFTARNRRPYLALKLAVSRDGKIAAAPGERTQITGPEANRDVHRLRSGFDAVMIGSGTALIDDPLLTVRHGLEPRRAPARVVLDSACRIGPRTRLLATVEEAPVVVLATGAAPADRVRELEQAGATVMLLGEGQDGRVRLEDAMAACWEIGLGAVLCEGGARLAGALIGAGLVERLYLYEAPHTLGEGGVGAFADPSHAPVCGPWRAAGEPLRLGRDTGSIFDRDA